MKGRPNKPNCELELSGSKNKRLGGIESSPLELATLPPGYLSSGAQRQWLLVVPPLASAGIAQESDRMVLSLLCDCLARFYDNTVGEDKRPLIDERERSKILKQIIDISDKFGMNPLARSRSGVSKKTLGVKQRP